MLTADEVLGVVRVHADRVHDAVRRLGSGPEAAVGVVQRSALDLVEAARQPTPLPDPVGWWFARARALGRAPADEDETLPVGGGVLGGDANQVRLAEALELRPERERAALLLRDSYDLPAVAVGTALGLDAVSAMEVVGAARLAFLPALLGGSTPTLPDHPVDVGSLARLAEGGQLAARDATTRRHVQSCNQCGDALDAMERARRLLSGLTVVALPDRDREALLSRVETRARQVLPAAAPEAEAYDAYEDEPPRRFSWSMALLGLVLAVGLGLGGGILASRGHASAAITTGSSLPLVTAAPVLSLAPRAPVPGVTSGPTVRPSPRVFLITPTPTATPSASSPAATASASATTAPTITAEPLSLVLTPSTGPNDTEITINGTGWTPGAAVTLTYVQAVTGTPGSTATATVDARGRFTAALTAHDAQGVPGDHQVRAQDGEHQATATFSATG